jgi:endonuclease YncB( thermonuclease family)
MPGALTTTASYRELLVNIRKEMERGLRGIEEFLERQKVLSYWSIGRKINTYLNAHQQPRGAVGQFYRNLSRDLQMSDRTLQQCEQFSRYFPKLKVEKELKWSHYRFLLTEADPGKRAAWIKRIKKEKILADELRLKLLPPAESDKTQISQFKEPVRGKLYTYRLLRADDIENFEVPWFVDLGFAGRREAPSSSAVLHNKNLYTSEKTEDGYRLKVTDARVEELFTFRGKLRRVIDGDTLLVNVDQGFSCWIEQRLRLKGIDAPELSTLAGERAKKWVEDELKDCRNLVVKTYKSDRWDRYLVDVFYIPEETDLNRIAAEGTWLNGRMVEAGVAGIWKA